MFHIETNFQDAVFGKIPRDWHMQTTKELGEVVTGITPSTLVKDYWDGEYPFVTPTDITDSKYVERTERKVTAKGLERGRLIPRDSVLVTCIASIGKMALAFEDCLTNQQINSVICKKGVNPHYVYYALGLRANTLKSWAGRTTNPIIKKSLFEKFPISIPINELEQQSIAEVLSVVDLTVAKTGEVIAKTERLKKGLMQELLTKGIGHKEYKQTSIAKIPKEWNVVQLEDLISGVKNGFASGKRDEKGIVQVRMNNITTDGRLILESYLKVPTPENIAVWLLKPNDFLFNNTNSIDLVGKSAIFKGASFPCTFSNHFTRIRFKENLVLPEWILYHFITHWEKGYFKSVAIRHVGQAAVHTEYLLRLKISLPPLDEQKKIVKILSTTNRKLELERNEKTKLKKIKRVLMDLLLTGKVRVKED